jgi:hypothetical protein
VAKQHLRQPRLQGHQWWLVDVAKRETLAADEVVQLIAKDAVTGVLRKNVSDNLNGELYPRKGEAKPEDRAKVGAGSSHIDRVSSKYQNGIREPLRKVRVSETIGRYFYSHPPLIFADESIVV